MKEIMFAGFTLQSIANGEELLGELYRIELRLHLCEPGKS